jgi:hypothetical protein
MIETLAPAGAAAAVGKELLVTAHHPDRVRWPPAEPRALGADMLEHAKLWNVFRALELVSPAFWLRRLHARLTGAPLTPAPQIVQVVLWRELMMPPALCLDGAQPPAMVDVWIETEHAVWAVLLASRVASSDADETPAADAVARVIDASAWHAGGRDRYFGIIEGTGDIGSRIATRYGRSIRSAQMRSAQPPHATVEARPPGVLQWRDLVEILADCANAPMLSPVERIIAGHAAHWLEQPGVSPFAAPAL